MEPGQLVPPGIWTLADVMEYGHKHGTCPYFTVRRMVCFAPPVRPKDTKLVLDGIRRRSYIFISLPT